MNKRNPGAGGSPARGAHFEKGDAARYSTLARPLEGRIYHQRSDDSWWIERPVRGRRLLRRLEKLSHERGRRELADWLERDR
jgi:hypothetical protein